MSYVKKPGTSSKRHHVTIGAVNTRLSENVCIELMYIEGALTQQMIDIAKYSRTAQFCRHPGSRICLGDDLRIIGNCLYLLSEYSSVL